MKRHPVLQPFSRDHNMGLIVARHLMERPGPESVSELRRVWSAEMDDHFQEEELLLLPMAPPEMGERLREEHKLIREGVAASGEQPESELVALGQLIHDHIRWEERVLFPALESTANLAVIEEQTAAIEKRRKGLPHNPRRGNL